MVSVEIRIDAVPVAQKQAGATLAAHHSALAARQRAGHKDKSP
jgi:hypothetical protein